MAKIRFGTEGDLYRTVGTRIRSLRDVAGLKQEDLASRVGLSRASIANIEAGKQAVPLHVLLAIARNLDSTLDGLVTSSFSPGVAPAQTVETPKAVQAFVQALGSR